MQKLTNYFFSVIISNHLWLGLLLVSLHVQADISDEKIAAFVEALRLAAPKSGSLYSDWQVKAANISSWSQRCLGRTLTPTEFAADLELARAILECKMGKVFREQYELSQYNEAVAVQRTAAWWMTGVAEQYQSSNIADYTKKILNLYYHELKNLSPGATESPTTTEPSSLPTTLPDYQEQNDLSSAATEFSTTTESSTLPPSPPVETTAPPAVPNTESLTSPPTESNPPASNNRNQEVTTKQINDLVEAIRLATPKNHNQDDNLYGEWQLKPSAIRSWSRECLQQELTPDDFAANPQMSRTILQCKIGQILKREYATSTQDIFVAVRRTAAWWISGDPQQYKTGIVGNYTLKVLEFYLQL
jgi:hypothetical protein